MIVGEKVSVNVKVNAPFEFCEGCPNMMIEKTTYFAGGKEHIAIFECSNQKICRDAVDRYRDTLKESKKQQRD